MKEVQKSNKFSILLRTVGALMFGLVIGDAAQTMLNDKPTESAFERFFGSTSALSLSDVERSKFKPVWCEMDGGYALMLDPERQLSEGLLLKQQVGNTSRYFELVPEKLIMLGYSYSVRGVDVASYGTVSLSMFALKNSNGAEKVYELNINNVNALNSKRDSYGICRFDKPAELPQNASADGYTPWSVLSVQGTKYAVREMIVDGRHGVYYEFSPHIEGQVASDDVLGIGFEPSTGRTPEQPVMFIPRERAATQAHQTFTQFNQTKFNQQ